MLPKKQRNAIKTDLFADQHHKERIDKLGDPLSEIACSIDFAALAAEVNNIASRAVSPQGGRPPFPTETMVRILVLKRLYNLSDEQMEYQLLVRMSYQRFCGLSDRGYPSAERKAWLKANSYRAPRKTYCAVRLRRRVLVRASPIYLI